MQEVAKVSSIHFLKLHILNIPEVARTQGVVFGKNRSCLDKANRCFHGVSGATRVETGLW